MTGSHWESVLQGLCAEALDCLQSNLALLADHAFGPGMYLRLGREWRFPKAEDVAVGHLQPSLLDRLKQAKQAGLSTYAPPGPIDAAQLHAYRDTGRALYVVADAYDLPWVPYAGHEHMPHSFLIEAQNDEYLVADAYHNDTQWGPARPRVWRLGADVATGVVSSGAIAVTVAANAHLSAAPPLAEVLAANAAQARAAGDYIERYVDAVRCRAGHPQAVTQLALDIWVLGRERLLHALWLGEHLAAARVAERAEAWRHLAARSYLALRRHQPVSDPLLDDLAGELVADAAVATALAAAELPEGPVTRAVLDALQRTLNLDERTIRRSESLRALPGFDSFRLVDVIARVESHLGVILPPDIAGESLRDVAGLCRLFTDATMRTER